jgi:hypothetical protein
MLRELILVKITKSFQAGKEIALIYVTYKINIQMKHLQVDCFKFSLIMNLKLDFKKYILPTAFLTLIQCLMII